MTDGPPRGDALAVAIHAGRLLGIAEARGIIGVSRDGGLGAIAEAMRIADDLRDADPVLATTIREAALNTLHGRTDGTFEGTAHDVTPAELEPGTTPGGPA